MREIKFRTLDNMGVWWYFTLQDFVKKTDALTDVLENWCQFTGLLDKNGKEIYESDKVLRGGEEWEVKWSHDHWGLYRGDFELGDNNDRSDPVSIYWNGLKVVGNIYESNL